MTARPSLPDVRPGDPILPAFQELVSYERAGHVMTGHRVRRRQHADGTSLSVDAPAPLWLHPWKVLLTGQEATVRPGTVNGVVPFIGTVRLDAATPPRLKITGSPGKGLRSWIHLRVLVDEGGAIDPENPAAAVIVHSDQDMPTLQALAEPRTGWQALALIVWQTRTVIGRVYPAAHHNLGFAWKEAEGPRPGQALFWAV